MKKLVKTDFKIKVNEGSSWIVYITETREEATAIHYTLLTQSDMLLSQGWHYDVSTVDVASDCRVPKFFHNRGYFATIVEHNNGDWKKPSTYCLYIAE